MNYINFKKILILFVTKRFIFILFIIIGLLLSGCSSNGSNNIKTQLIQDSNIDMKSSSTKQYSKKIKSTKKTLNNNNKKIIHKRRYYRRTRAS